MLSKLHDVPIKWKWSAVFLLVLVHALPLLFTAHLLWPQERNTLQTVSKNSQLSFMQASSKISVKKSESESKLPSTFQVKLHTLSKTNNSTSMRQDVTLLYQDGVLVGKTKHLEKDVDSVVQQLEVTSKYNHLFQAISYHYAETHDDSYLHQMSDDYLYISATKYGGIQTFHQPETVQQQKIKQMIDHQVNQQLNFEYHDAFEKFHIDPHDYFLFPLSQLPLYGSEEQLPGIPSEFCTEIIRRIWGIIQEQIVMGPDEKAQGSSMPLLLIAKDGTFFTVLYRAADGLYHRWEQPVQDDLK